MFIYEHEIIVKDIFVILTAFVGLMTVLFIYLKNMQVRLRPVGRRLSDLQKYLDNINNTRESDSSNWNDFTVDNYCAATPNHLCYQTWSISVFSRKKVLFPQMKNKNITKDTLNKTPGRKIELSLDFKIKLRQSKRVNKRYHAVTTMINKAS